MMVLHLGQHERGFVSGMSKEMRYAVAAKNDPQHSEAKNINVIVSGSILPLCGT